MQEFFGINVAFRNPEDTGPGNDSQTEQYEGDEGDKVKSKYYAR